MSSRRSVPVAGVSQAGPPARTYARINLVRSNVKTLLPPATMLALVAAVSLSPAMGPGAETFGGNTWAGISQRVDTRAPSAMTAPHYEYQYGYDHHAAWGALGPNPGTEGWLIQRVSRLTRRKASTSTTPAWPPKSTSKRVGAVVRTEVTGRHWPQREFDGTTRHRRRKRRHRPGHSAC